MRGYVKAALVATATLLGLHVALKYDSWCALGGDPEMDRLLGDVSRALKTTNVTFWVTGGTALGLARHGELIRHDDDVDFCIETSVRLGGIAFASFGVTSGRKQFEYAT